MAKTLMDFMENRLEFDWYGYWKLINNKQDIFLVHEGKSYPIHDEDDLIELVEELTGNEIRICSHCGSPMDHGMTDGYDYAEEECFHPYMNYVYGRGKWRPYEDGRENEEGGYYEYLDHTGEWFPTGWFYTEWY